MALEVSAYSRYCLILSPPGIINQVIWPTIEDAKNPFTLSTPSRKQKRYAADSKGADSAVMQVEKQEKQAIGYSGYKPGILVLWCLNAGFPSRC